MTSLVVPQQTHGIARWRVDRHVRGHNDTLASPAVMSRGGVRVYSEHLAAVSSVARSQVSCCELRAPLNSTKRFSRCVRPLAELQSSLGFTLSTSCAAAWPSCP